MSFWPEGTQGQPHTTQPIAKVLVVPITEDSTYTPYCTPEKLNWCLTRVFIPTTSAHDPGRFS